MIDCTPVEHTDIFTFSLSSLIPLSQDAHSFFYDFNGVRNQGFFAVFDGHGGKSAAEWCGDKFHEVLSRHLPPSKEDDNSQGRIADDNGPAVESEENDIIVPISEIFDQTFIEADSYLTAAHGIYSGCTAVVALVRLEERHLDDNYSAAGPKSAARKCLVPVLYTANVGDSRAVLLRSDKAVRLSYDHKGSDMCEQQRVKDAGGFILNERVNGMLAITRALGDAEMKDYISGRPYTAETILTTTDPLLILACDGLWDVCSDQEACDLIRDIPDPQEAAKVLVEYGLTNGSYDNMSVLVVRFHPEKYPPLTSLEDGQREEGDSKVQ